MPDTALKNPVTNFYDRLSRAISTASGDAYRHFDERHSYADLAMGMRRINGCLKPFRGKPVAVYAGKGFASYGAIFATLLSGNTWVPFNPDIPVERNLKMMASASPAVVLTDRQLPDRLAALAGDLGAAILSLNEVVEAGREEEFSLDAIDPDGIAYIMFTSGSTGTPKGVPMTHRNYINFIENAMQIIPFGDNEVFADYHDFGFDISVFYLFCGVLAQGAFAPARNEQDRLVPINHIRENGVTVVASVPSLISRLRALRRDGLPDLPLHILFMCGEPFRLDALDYCLNKMRVSHVYNFYGLTETGVENFHHECRPDDLVRYADMGFVPIGKPLSGNDIRFAEDGELLISGCQVTPGYLDGIGKDRFIEIDAIRWYRTGDKVIEAQGVFFCKGRLDTQVKIGGYRVELMDVEANIRAIDGVEEAVCFVETVKDRAFLVAGLHGGRTLSAGDVRVALSNKLPPHMIPAVVFEMETVPLNRSGKVDRGACARCMRKWPMVEATPFPDSASGLVAEAMTLAVADVNATLPPAMRIDNVPGAILMGEGRTIDSLGLVTLLAAIESRVRELSGLSISLDTLVGASAGEPSMVTLGGLSAYARGLFDKAKAGE